MRWAELRGNVPKSKTLREWMIGIGFWRSSRVLFLRASPVRTSVVMRGQRSYMQTPTSRRFHKVTISNSRRLHGASARCDIFLLTPGEQVKATRHAREQLTLSKITRGNVKSVSVRKWKCKCILTQIEHKLIFGGCAQEVPCGGGLITQTNSCQEDRCVCV